MQKGREGKMINSFKSNKIEEAITTIFLTLGNMIAFMVYTLFDLYKIKAAIGACIAEYFAICFMCFIERIMLYIFFPKCEWKKKPVTCFLVSGIAATVIFLQDSTFRKGLVVLGSTPYIIMLLLMGIYISPLEVFEIEIKKDEQGKGFIKMIVKLLASIRDRIASRFDMQLQTWVVSIIVATIIDVGMINYEQQMKMIINMVFISFILFALCYFYSIGKNRTQEISQHQRLKENDK